MNDEYLLKIEKEKYVLEEKLLKKMKQATYYKKKYQKAKNIIKEAREYIETELWNYFDERNIYLKVRDKLLEILKKENK